MGFAGITYLFPSLEFKSLEKKWQWIAVFCFIETNRLIQTKWNFLDSTYGEKRDF